MNRLKQVKKHWFVLAAATSLCGASLGLVLNTIGLFIAPIANDLNVYLGSISLHVTIMFISLAVVSLFVPRLIDSIGYKPTLIIGVALTFLSTAPMGLTDNVFIYYLMGLVRGAGASMFAMVPITLLINNWFEERIGLALSIANAAAGLVGAIFSIVFSSIIESFGWRIAFLWKGIFIVLLCLPGILYPYSPDPKEEGLLAYGENEFESDSTSTLSKGVPRALSFRNIAFVSILLFALFHSIVLALTAHVPAFGESQGLSFQAAGFMMSASMVGNIFCKLLLGYLTDKIGVVKATATILLTNILALLLFIFSSQSSLLILGAFLFGSINSIGSITFSVLPKQYFGRRMANRIFPILNFVMNFGSALAITFIGYIYDFTGTYISILIFSVIINMVNMFLLSMSTKTPET